MRNKRVSWLSQAFGPLLLAAILSLAIGLVAQQPQQSAGPFPLGTAKRRTPDSPVPLEAEKRALEEVALSADTILQILSKETGLFLEVKKALVREAFEQGRLIDPEDLTDDAVMTLIREDLHARVIATHEIVDRYYVRAKPNKQERAELENEQSNSFYHTPPLQTEDQLAIAQATNGKTPNANGTPVQQNQEDQYWQMQGRLSQGQGLQQNQAPPSQYGPIQPSPVPPSQSPSYNPNLQMNRARLEAQGIPDEQYSSISADMSELQGLSGLQGASSSQMPLLASAAKGGMAAGSLQSAAGQYQQSQATQSGMGALSDLGASLLGQALGSEAPPQLNQQASLDTRSQLPIRPFHPTQQEDPHPVIRHRANPYANVPSLYDLYSQVSRRQPVLDRFGMDIFQNGSGNLDDLPMDLPVGPEYVLGPGDSVSVNLWGTLSQRLQRTVDREGRLTLPQVGTVLVAGKTLGEAQQEVQTVLRSQFRDIDADLSLSRLRTVRIYVVGFAVSPGAYDISALSTPLNALIAAGGPTEGGSLRFVRHYRGKQLVQEVDLYDLILHGVRSDVKTLQPGDTILVPPLRKEVTVEGMVRRPAIYEMRDETTLSDVLELAGGVLPSGTLRHIDVERLQSHEMRSMLSLNIPETDNEQTVEKALDAFKIQEGDKIRISPIRPYSEKTVYLDGHVFHPGKYPYRDGMKIADLIESYKDLLPEPYQKHAEIIRLDAPDFRPEVIPFNLADAMSGKQGELTLKPFDTVRIFGRYDFEDAPIITVTGEVRDPGDHATNGATHLSDAVFLAGGATPDASMNTVEIYRKEGDSVRVMSADLGKALAGDATEDLLLQPRDSVIVHRDLARLDPATVIIGGEVAHPGKYILGDNMTAASLVRLAGGLKRGAYAQSADLARYVVENGTRVLGEHQEVPLAEALAGKPDTDIRLHDGDVLTVRQLTNWNDVEAVIDVKGEVTHPGAYGIKEGERLSSILARAGGFNKNAYPYGVVLLRKDIREVEQRNQAELLERLQGQQLAIQGMPDSSADLKQAKEAALQQWEITVERVKNSPPSGRVIVRISKDIHHWANTSNDLVVQKGDVLIIPKRPSSVVVTGQVYNTIAVTYHPGKSAKWYLEQSGGPTTLADKKAIFVVKADGSVIGGSSSGWWTGSSLNATLQPGDSVFVPEKAVAGPKDWAPLLSMAQVAASITVATSYLLK